MLGMWKRRREEEMVLQLHRICTDVKFALKLHTQLAKEWRAAEEASKI